MPPSEPPADEPPPHRPGSPNRPGTPGTPGAMGVQHGIPTQPNRPQGSWDPVDDEVARPAARRPHWSWHGRASWGRRSVQAYPLVAAFLAVVLVVVATSAARSTLDHEVTIDGVAPAGGPGQGSSGTYTLVGGAQATQVLAFDRSSRPVRHIEGSTSLALPPYAGWEANGSDVVSRSLTSVHGGRLWVGVTQATPQFRGWFLTTAHPTVADCSFQFWAASPPPLPPRASGASGELVMAVQTSDTVRTGDIDYVFVSERVEPDGRRSLLVGYALGHVRNAVTHVLKDVAWSPGPLHVSIRTDGRNQLSVWVDGTSFFRSSALHLGIVPPFEPYLEVQARRTPYTVSYTRYAATCGSDVTVKGVPDGAVGVLGSEQAVARHGELVLPLAEHRGPVSGRLRVRLPGGGRTVRFAPHTYWPGDVFTYQPGA